MKKWFIIALSVAMVSCGGSKKEISVTFESYTGYFVKNDVTPSTEPFYLATNNFDEFEKYFGIAATMSKQSWIEKDKLANQLIIAVANKTDNDTEAVEIQTIKNKVMHYMLTML